MWQDRVSNPGPLTYESGALPTALRGPATLRREAEVKMVKLCPLLVYIFIFSGSCQGPVREINMP